MGEKPFLLSFSLSFRPSVSDATCARVDVTGWVEKKRGSDPTPPHKRRRWPVLLSFRVGWGEKTHAKERRALPWSSIQPPSIRDGGEGGPAFNKKSLVTTTPPTTTGP